MGKRRVGMLTTFCDVTSGYSLITVAETQIRMLLDHYYDPAILTQEGERWQDHLGEWHFKPFQEHGLWDRRKIDLRPVVPWRAIAYGDDFEGAVEAMVEALRENLAEVEVCIAHDIILQTWYVVHNIAMRRYAAERPDLTWLHWIHSCPGWGRPIAYPHNARHTPPPGYIIYPNSSDLGFPMRAYRVGEDRVIAHPHTLDPLAGLSPQTKALVSACDFLDADVRCIYPVRMDRGKQPERIIELLAGCQAHGRTTKLLVCDWQSGGERFQRYMDELAEHARTLGVPVCFASRLDDRCNQGVPREVVLELFGLCNMYVHPSRVETYGFTVHEAMRAGCLCVLNADFPPMRERFGEAALYLPFGSDRFSRPERPLEYWAEQARIVLLDLDRQRALAARDKTLREWVPERAWESFERLLHLPPVEGKGQWQKP